jgi:hypothetical protein
VSRAADIRSWLERADELDRAWTGKVPETGRAFLPWMPFNTEDFLLLAACALKASAGDPPRFLEIGAGIGTKMFLASRVLGMDAFGIERVPEYVTQAAELGCPVELADAGGWDRYGMYDIVWLNRVYRDRSLEAQLEAQLWEDMAPGAVIMCAHLEAPPPSSWWTKLDDWEARRGVWLKPEKRPAAAPAELIAARSGC